MKKKKSKKKKKYKIKLSEPRIQITYNGDFEIDKKKYPFNVTINDELQWLIIPPYPKEEIAIFTNHILEEVHKNNKVKI